MDKFKPEDKILTRHKGAEVEATVRLLFGDEVQIRTPDGVLRWRTVRTVWRPESSPTDAGPNALSADSAQPEVHDLTPVEDPVIEGSDEEPTSASTEEIPSDDTSENPMEQGSNDSLPPSETPEESELGNERAYGSDNLTSCGIERPNKKRKRRRSR